MPARSPARAGPGTRCAIIWQCTPIISSRKSASMSATARSTTAICRNGASGGPGLSRRNLRPWVPAFAGMTEKGRTTQMNNEPDLIVFDPRGVVETEPLALSERPATLDGLRLGVLDNTKWNANRLLRKTVAKLQEEISFAAVNYYRKESFSKEADPALIAAIAADNDIVVTAIGD